MAASSGLADTMITWKKATNGINLDFMVTWFLFLPRVPCVVSLSLTNDPNQTFCFKGVSVCDKTPCLVIDLWIKEASNFNALSAND